MLADGGRVVGQNEKFWRSTTWQSHSAPPSPGPSPRQLSGFGDNRKPFPLTPRPLQPVCKVRPPPLQPPRRSIDGMREQGGRVFVHCCQGVSRSTSLVIAYLMWRDGRSFEDAFQDVKAARGVTNPNMGFACQLLQCQKRVHATPVSPNSALRMYRMAPHSAYDPLHLVPKTVNHPAASALDSRGAFVVHVPGALFVWQGSKCDLGMVVAAHAFTRQVVRYERAQGKNVQVFEGEEPSEFWEALRKQMPQSERTAEHQDPDAGKENGSPKPRRNTESGAACRTDVGEQTIPIATRSASLLQEDLGRKKAGLQGKAVELYEWPQMEKIDMFTEDDLDTHAAYILVVPDSPSGVGGHVYVWVGRGSRTNSPGEDGDVNRAGEEHWIMIGQDLIRQWQLRQDIPLKVVEDGNEPDEFWEYFVNG
ncbi:unnamed protein product [Sphagnum jensenii]|uniref:Protein-tyrosine-phosphatase n=1 Tax=Sphagnum jensenii TaxID=128206 RepID=A0ABP0W7M8_9BRYO